jgi:O-antigen/teichoic acid export membrane protein
VGLIGPESGLPGGEGPGGDEAPTGEDELAGDSLRRLARRLISGGVWALFGKLLTAGGGALVSVLLARLLPPAAVGAYFLGLSVVTAASIVARGGLEKTILQQVAESMARGQAGRTRATIRSVYLLAAGTAFLVGVVLWAGAGRWLTNRVFQSRELTSVVDLLVPWMVVLTFELLLAETFRGFDDIPKASLFGGALSRVLTVVIFTGLLALHGSNDLRTVILLTLLAYVGSLLPGARALWRRVSALAAGDVHTVRTGFVLRSTWPLLVTNLTVFATGQAGLWILGAYRPDDEVAMFGVCLRLVMLVGASVMIAAAVLPPVIGRLYVYEQRKKLERIMRMTASVAAVPSLIVLVAFVVAGRPILELAFGAYYGAGAGALALLSVGQILNVWVGACGNTLIMTGHQRDLMFSAIVSGTVTVVGSLVVVARWGVVGVAAATSLGMIVHQMLMLGLARVRCGIWTHASPLLLRDATVFAARAVRDALAGAASR